MLLSISAICACVAMYLWVSPSVQEVTKRACISVQHTSSPAKEIGDTHQIIIKNVGEKFVEDIYLQLIPQNDSVVLPQKAADIDINEQLMVHAYVPENGMGKIYCQGRLWPGDSLKITLKNMTLPDHNFASNVDVEVSAKTLLDVPVQWDQ